MSFVQTTHELTELRTEHALQGSPIASDDVDCNAPLTQRGGDFQGDEACANDDYLFRRSGLRGDVAAVGIRAEIVQL